MAAAAAAFLLPTLATWFAAVNNTVTEPYLDEVFHIKQAQHYCADRWHIWDPKITTPPGLYLLSYLLKPLLGCDEQGLRAINALCLIALFSVVRATYTVRGKGDTKSGYLNQLLAAHGSLNIALFPPLFFFSALYYTDIASTLSWAIFYWYFLRSMRSDSFSPVQGLVQVALGSVSLLFRQTNIFWVAVAPAAIVLVMELDKGHAVVKQSMYRRAEGFGDTVLSVAKTSWKMNVIYDPPVRDAFIEDYFRTLVSVATCGVKTLLQPAALLRLATKVSPYLTLIALFGSFTVYNGGVVLGDKSNHIATINLPQMLYLWPYITFFAWPLIFPHFLMLAMTLASRVSRLATLESLLVFRRRSFLPRPIIAIAFMLFAGLVVHFNTIVHPFMLADNRHYVFYVFKLLLRPWWVKYTVIPLYYLTAWVCIETRGHAAPSGSVAVPMRLDVDNGNQAPRANRVTEASEDSLKQNAAVDAATSARSFPNGESSTLVSFTLITVGVTALNLCSAPLVEPRYCIIPYIIWRMHLPVHTGVGHGHASSKKQATSTWSDVLLSYDYRLVLETVWYLVVNGVTGYIFLYRPFQWPSEPGKAQRFMW